MLVRHFPRVEMYDIAAFGADCFLIGKLVFISFNPPYLLTDLTALTVISLIVIAKSIAASKSLVTPLTYGGSRLSQDAASDKSIATTKNSNAEKRIDVRVDDKESWNKKKIKRGNRKRKTVNNERIQYEIQEIIR